jgi:hypothetical protein
MKRATRARRVADEGAADVADVHRLGDVRRGEIDDDAVWFGNGWNTKTIALTDLRQSVLERVLADREVQKSRTIDADFFAEILDLQMIGNGLCQCARVGAQLFGQVTWPVLDW